MVAGIAKTQGVREILGGLLHTKRRQKRHEVQGLPKVRKPKRVMTGNNDHKKTVRFLNL